MCTSLTLMADNQSNLLARTMDFAVNLEADFIVIPRNYPLLTTLPGPKPLGTYGLMSKGVTSRDNNKIGLQINGNIHGSRQ